MLGVCLKLCVRSNIQNAKMWSDQSSHTFQTPVEQNVKTNIFHTKKKSDDH